MTLVSPAVQCSHYPRRETYKYTLSWFFKKNCHKTRMTVCLTGSQEKTESYIYDTNHENISTWGCKTRMHLIFKALKSSIEFSVALTPIQMSTRIFDRCLDGHCRFWSCHIESLSRIWPTFFVVGWNEIEFRDAWVKHRRRQNIFDREQW